MNKEIDSVKKILGKYKYVYRLYKRENEFHIEQYPIVYSNSEFVYYKTGRDNKLDLIEVDGGCWRTPLKLGFYEAVEYLNTKKYTWYPTYVYFIETEKVKEHDLSLIKQELKTQSKESMIKEQEERVEKAKKSYEAAVDKLNYLKEKNKK